MLHFLYETVPGRSILKFLTMPWISRVSGAVLDHPVSRVLIPRFIKQNQIDMREFIPTDYKSFNEFFCRRIRPERRPIDREGSSLIAPCDGLLSIYRIKEGLVVPVKQSRYSVADLLGDEELARRYEGGTCLVFRLCVNHYHRYAYVDDGRKTENVHIAGRLHTVRPIALRQVPVFTENAREYTLIHTDHFGDVVQMEVGAMLVGRICNHMGAGIVRRGGEKGYFQYGGSTVILLLQKEKARFSKKLYQATADEIEIPVKMGQRISVASQQVRGQ
ncbi:MAG: phosphatidylserine decarboxylase [Eubacteriales bacterium]|nr:phosphatidylserine decarboxylase [Eubacteriales bacterium]